MPFKSRAQWRLCYALKARSEGKSRWNCKEWSRGVNYKKLPEYTTSSKSRSKSRSRSRTQKRSRKLMKKSKSRSRSPKKQMKKSRSYKRSRTYKRRK